MASATAAPDVAQELRIAIAACNAVLAKLAQLADGPAGASFNEHRKPGRSTKNAAESAIPRGTSLDGQSTETHPPSAELSLAAHYQWRMVKAAKAEDVDGLLHLAAMGRRDWRERMGTYRAPQDEYPKEGVRRLLAEWEGRSSMEVAIWERCPVRWVRRQRVLNKRDPETGLPVEQTDRLAKVVDMKNSGATRVSIAAEIGASHGIVDKLLDGEVA